MKRSTFFLFSAIGVAALGSSPARAAETCYGFSGLQDDRVFNIGETYRFQNLEVRVRDYKRDGGIQDPDGHYIKVQSTRIAGSKATEQSELYIYGATMQIELPQPVSQIRFRLAENRGGSLGRHANLQINGKVHEVVGGLRDLDGKVLGDAASGQYRVEVKLRKSEPLEPSDPPSHWSHGTMQVRALSGEIASFAIGSTPMVVDDVCLTPNAP